MEKYEVNKNLLNFETSLNDLKKALNLEALNKKLNELNIKMQESSFWNDSKSAKKVTKEANGIEKKISSFLTIEKEYKDIIDWLEVSEEGSKEWNIMEEDINRLAKKIEQFELEILLNDPYDSNNAIVELHPGAGGTESQDWCDMLFRMYQKYALRSGYKLEVLDYQAGEEAGVKSVTLLIKGDYAYGYLKSERGVHRLVRISPFDSNARRHTSFVSVDVLPEIDDEVSIEIKDEDIKVDVYRSSGAGGQSVNTTDSAVRITHLATGIVVTCQNERSQIKNRETALSLLKSKLVQVEIKKHEEELKKIKGEQKDISWGSQIRSYVFHPYQLVKDHRNNYEVGNTSAVMDGEIDGFINAYLKTGGHNE